MGELKDMHMFGENAEETYLNRCIANVELGDYFEINRLRKVIITLVISYKVAKSHDKEEPLFIFFTYTDREDVALLDMLNVDYENFNVDEAVRNFACDLSNKYKINLTYKELDEAINNSIEEIFLKRL